MKMIKHFALALSLAMGLGFQSVSAQSLSPNTKWHWNEGTIVVDSPERAPGQTHVLNLTAPKIQTVRVAFVGLGMRGPGAVNRFCHIPGVEIVALCDYEAARAEGCQKMLRNAGLKPADIYSGEELMRRIWPDRVVVTDRSVDVHITRLRAKIAPYSRNIVSRSGYGYGWLPD